MTTTHQPGGDLAAPNDVRSRWGSATALAGGGVLAAAALSLHLRGGAPESVEFVRRVEAASPALEGYLSGTARRAGHEGDGATTYVPATRIAA